MYRWVPNLIKKQHLLDKNGSLKGNVREKLLQGCCDCLYPMMKHFSGGGSGVFQDATSQDLFLNVLYM